jgi:chromosome segregation ATPase
LVRASDLQSDELDRLEDIETQLTIAERDLESLQDQYDNLEATYFALSTTYHKVNAELDAAKRNLSTAITAIFLSSILFYFLGQRGIVRRES